MRKTDSTRSAASPGALIRAIHMTLALTALLALSIWGWYYPLGSFVAWLAGGAAIIAFAAQPGLWLLLLPALWPIVDLAPWTGWIHATESDALVLAVIAGVGFRHAIKPLPRAADGSAFKLSAVTLALFGLLAVSVGVSALRTPIPMPPFDTALFAGYKTPLNGVRILKGFAWAILLAPALHAAGRVLGQRAVLLLSAGMIAGLTTAALAATWERYAFPGLFDFSSDYRTTGLFWDMHVGGAALDAWLALTFPFALAAFLRATETRLRIVTLGLLALAAYAVFTTFSRGLYAGVAVGLAVLAIALYREFAGSQAGNSTAPARPFGAALAALALLCVAPASFSGGGYRGLAALLGFALLIYVFGGIAHHLPRREKVIGIATGLLLGAISTVAVWLPKGPYLAFGLFFLAALGIAGFHLRARALDTLPVAGLILTTASGIAAALVGLYWGEGKGDVGIVVAIGAGLAVLAIQLGKRPLWHATTVGAMNVLLILGAVAAVAAGLGSYYVGERFSTTSSDLAHRVAHWRDGVSLATSTADAWLGIGLGRYPEAYFWAGPLASNAGSWQLPTEEGNRFSRLAASRSVLGFGELFRISQRVDHNTEGPFHFRIRVRAPAESGLHVEVCRKHLLYTNHCSSREIAVTNDTWTIITGTTTADQLPLSGGLSYRPSVLSLATSGRAPLDIDDVEVIDSSGRSLLVNGNFDDGVDRWFFSSDRHHLPWHAKNLLLHVWVEQGWLGVAAVVLILLAALGRITLGRARHHPFSPPLAAGIVGYLVVGLFDSLLDMPRMTLMLFLLCWVALSLKAPAGRGKPAHTARP